MIADKKHADRSDTNNFCLMVIFIKSYSREFFVAVDDDSRMKPKLLCGQMSQFFVLVQAHRVPVFSHSEREIHGVQGFQVHYFTLNDSVWEGKTEKVTYV